MAQRLGRYTILLEKKVAIESSAAVVGKKEGEGPLSSYFDVIQPDTTFGEKTFEKGESQMQKLAVETLFTKSKYKKEDVHYIFAGDLLNQCIATSFGIRDLQIPFVGLYGACSTMAESLAVSSVYLDSGAADCCIALTSSHFATAERQYRLPLEYGGQRTPTSQWTTTGSGALMVAREETGPFVRKITFGQIEDLGIKDANNMGAAMAPAAASTLLRYFKDTKEKPENFDLILTGDLGQVGSDLLYKLLEREGLDITKQHNDCGLLIFDLEKQDVHAGASGCGCAASVFSSYILTQLREKKLNRILFMATGALLSPTSAQQGESIPSVAHLLEISNTMD